MPYKQHRAFRVFRGFCQSLSDRQNRNCSRAVIVGAVIDLVGGCRICADSYVIVMGTDGDHFAFQHRVAAFPNGDYILG